MMNQMARIQTVWRPPDQRHDTIIVTASAVWARYPDATWKIVYQQDEDAAPEYLYYRWLTTRTKSNRLWTGLFHLFRQIFRGNRSGTN